MSQSSAVNDQITDAARQINDLLAATSDPTTDAIGNLVLIQAVALAMQNAVAQQQQAYILRNAATTAAVKAIIESNPEQALELIDKTLPGEDVSVTLNQLKKLMDEIPSQVASATARVRQAARAEPAAEGETGGGRAAKKPARKPAGTKPKSSGGKS